MGVFPITRGLTRAALFGAACVFCLFACGLARAECVPMDQAKNLEGKPGCVTGKVLKVSQSQSGNQYLDFCTNYRECPFTVYIPRADADKLGNLKPLEGQQVEIYGKIQQYNGRTEIILRDKRQLEGEKKKYVPPDEERRLSSRNEHSAEFHNPHQSIMRPSRSTRSSSKSTSKSSKTAATTSSTTAPVERPQ